MFIRRHGVAQEGFTLYLILRLGTLDHTPQTTHTHTHRTSLRACTCPSFFIRTPAPTDLSMAAMISMCSYSKKKKKKTASDTAELP